MTSEAEAESQSQVAAGFLCVGQNLAGVCVLETWSHGAQSGFELDMYLYLQCYNYKCVPCIVSWDSNPGLHAYQVSLLPTSNERWSGEAQGQGLQFNFLVEKPDTKVLSCVHYDCELWC